jgi:hypothetical protein
MKLMKKLLFGLFLFLFVASAQIKLIAQSSYHADSLTKFVLNAEDEMDRIDKSSSDKNILSKQIPYSGLPTKKINVAVDVRNDGIVRKLIYNSYDESYKTSSKEIYYFDNSGKLLSHVSSVTGTLIHELFSVPYVLIYSKSGKKIVSNALVKDYEADYILADTKFIVDYYLSCFKGIKYSTFDVSKNTSIVLKTQVVTELRKAPNLQATVIKKLPRGSELQYVDRSPQQDSLLPGKEKWIWLKVKVDNKQEGWVWGHPSIVKEY